MPAIPAVLRGKDPEWHFHATHHLIWATLIHQKWNEIDVKLYETDAPPPPPFTFRIYPSRDANYWWIPKPGPWVICIHPFGTKNKFDPHPRKVNKIEVQTPFKHHICPLCHMCGQLERMFFKHIPPRHIPFHPMLLPWVPLDELGPLKSSDSTVKSTKTKS